jgi:hypothetical protein
MDLIGFFFLLVVLIIGGIVIAISNEGSKIEGPDLLVSELQERAILSGHGVWDVTIYRRSGNVHDERVVEGSAVDALNSALSTCKRAQIGEVILNQNEEAQMEFWTSNLDVGRGKSVGGFKIQLREQSDDAVGQNPDLQIIEDDPELQSIADGIDDVKIGIAQLLWSQAKANQSEEQEKALASVDEYVLVGLIASQLSNIDDQGQIKVDVPVDYVDPDGDHHSVVTLTFRDADEG